jgi:hypothetical protein
METEQKLHLLEKDILIVYPVTDKKLNYSGIRKVKVITKGDSFTMLVDERFNQIDFIYNDNPDDPFKHSNKISSYLKEKYDQLISSDFRYKRGSGYDGDRTAYLEDFISFLRKENRDCIIENILQD